MLNQDSKKVVIFQSWFKSFNVHGLHEYNCSFTGINIERVLLLFNSIEIIVPENNSLFRKAPYIIFNNKHFFGHIFNFHILTCCEQTLSPLRVFVSSDNTRLSVAT